MIDWLQQHEQQQLLAFVLSVVVSVVVVVGDAQLSPLLLVVSYERLPLEKQGHCCAAGEAMMKAVIPLLLAALTLMSGKASKVVTASE